MMVKGEAHGNSTLSDADEDEGEIANGDDACAEKEPEGVETHTKTREGCEHLRNSFLIDERRCVSCGFVHDWEYHSLECVAYHACRKLQHRALNHKVFQGDIRASIDVYANEKVGKDKGSHRREELLRHQANGNEANHGEENNREPRQAENPSTVIFMLKRKRKADNEGGPNKEENADAGLKDVKAIGD